MTHHTLTAYNLSTWVATATPPSPYGKTTPAGRQWWVFLNTGGAPPHLSGILGFYAPSLEAARERLSPR